MQLRYSNGTILVSVGNLAWQVIKEGTVCRRVGLYRVSQEEWTKLRDGVPYVKIY